LLLAISVCSESMSVTCSKLVKCNEDEITKSSWDPDSQERDLMRGAMARAEIEYPLKVIRTHLSIPAISMQTFETPRRSFLTGVEKFPRTFAVELNISPDPVATRGTYRGEMLQENLTTFGTSHWSSSPTGFPPGRLLMTWPTFERVVELCHSWRRSRRS
jgi:hypothetical protein